MALNFPSSPAVNDTYTSGGFTWKWTGSAWVSDPGAVVDIGAYLAANGDTVADAFGFIGGTKVAMPQTTAPTSWTKDNTHNDKTIRAVSGTVGSGGSTAFSTVFASRTPAGSISSDSLSIAQLAAHGHDVVYYTPGGGGPISPQRANISAAATISTSSAGSGSTHGHIFSGSAMDFAVQYADVAFMTKD